MAEPLSPKVLSLFHSISPRENVTLIEGDAATAEVDAAPEVPSLRTLGSGPTQAVAGDDPRLAGGPPDGPAATPSLRTLGVTGNQAAAGDDPRFEKARVYNNSGATVTNKICKLKAVAASERDEITVVNHTDIGVQEDDLCWVPGSIANGAYGYAYAKRGRISGDFSSLAVGAPVYLTTAGGLSASPSAVRIGRVTVSSASGYVTMNIKALHTLNSYAQLRTVAGREGQVIALSGRATARDGGQGDFVWKVGAVADDDGHIISGPVGSGGYWDRLDPIFKPEQFGAAADGTTNDNDAFVAMCLAITTNNGGIVEFRQNAVYIVGKQDFAGVYGLGYSYRPRDVIRLNAITGALHFEWNGAVLRNATGLKYGSFNPTTGVIHNAPPGGFTDSNYAAWGPVHLYLTNCTGGITTAGKLESDGKHASFSTGGYWGDVGYQLKSDFAELIDCGAYHIDGVYGHHHGRDGVVTGIFGLTEADRGGPRDVPQRLTNCRFTYAGRNNLSLIGGIGFSATDCDFSQSGRGVFASQPAAGIDIEAEGSIVRNAVFTRCTAINAGGNAMVAASGDSADCRFIDCTFAGYYGSGYNSHVESKPGFVFERTRFIGGFAVPGIGASYVDCEFTDEGHFPYVLCTLALAAGTYAPKTLIANVSGNTARRYWNIEEVVSPGGSVGNIKFASAMEVTGTPMVAASVGTITQIFTPVAGWTSITNNQIAPESYGRWTVAPGSWAFTLSPVAKFENPPSFTRCKFKARYSNLMFQDNYSLYDKRERFDDCEFIVSCLDQVNGNGLIVKFGSDNELTRCTFKTEFPPGSVVTGTGSIQIGRQQNNVINEGNIIAAGAALVWTDATTALGGGFSPKQRQRKAGLGETDPRIPLVAEMRHGIGLIPDHLTSSTTSGRLQIARNGLPLDGTWLAGDRSVDLTPGTSGYVDAECLVGGTPGTWQYYGRVGSTRVALTSPITVSPTDLCVHSNLTVAGAVVMNLPSGVPVGWNVELGDAKGDAAMNNITLVCPGAETWYESGTANIKITAGYTTAVVRKLSSTKWKVVSTT